MLTGGAAARRDIECGEAAPIFADTSPNALIVGEVRAGKRVSTLGANYRGYDLNLPGIDGGSVRNSYGECQ